jgi:hypothetical protein
MCYLRRVVARLQTAADMVAHTGQVVQLWAVHGCCSTTEDKDRGGSVSLPSSCLDGHGCQCDRGKAGAKGVTFRTVGHVRRHVEPLDGEVDGLTGSGYSDEDRLKRICTHQEKMPSRTVLFLRAMHP